MKIFPPGNPAVISTAAYSHLDDLFTVKLACLWRCVDERTQLSDVLVLSGSRICGTGNLPCNLVRVHALWVPCVSLHNTVCALCQLTKHRMYPVSAYETLCMYPVSAYKTLHVLCVSLQNTLHVPCELTKHCMFLHINTF